MKNKIINVVFKKFQSYSFIIFLILVLGAFFALSQLNNDNKKDDIPTNDPVDNNDDDDDDDVDDTNNVENEVFKLPLSVENIIVVRDFWDPNGTKEEQMDAIVNVDNYYFMNRGVNYATEDDTEFDVEVSLSGTVTKVKQDMLVGYLVEVEHLYGIKTVYHSLSNVNVAVGDELAQGDVIGTSGGSNFDTESGTHVHFEILNNGVKLNPNELIGTGISEFNTSE